MAPQNKIFHHFYLVIFFTILVITIVNGQDNKFIFGAQSGINFSQIDGDNLRGFNKVGYEVGLYGGYLFSPNNAIMFHSSYGILGSKRNNERPPKSTSQILAQVDYSMVSVFAAFSSKVGDNWEGTKKFRLFVGPKYNYVINSNSKLRSAVIGEVIILKDSDIKKSYISLRGGIGFLIIKGLSLDIIYEHGLQNLLTESENTNLSRLIPYHFGLSLSYHIN